MGGHVVREVRAARGGRPGCGPCRHQLTHLPLRGADERKARTAPAPDRRRKGGSGHAVREARATRKCAGSAEGRKKGRMCSPGA